MHCPESLYFSASPIGTAVQKLAPGLCAEYKIVFTPKEINDYSHELIFHTKEQSFSVPIIGTIIMCNIIVYVTSFTIINACFFVPCSYWPKSNFRYS